MFGGPCGPPPLPSPRCFSGSASILSWPLGAGTVHDRQDVGFRHRYYLSMKKLRRAVSMEILRYAAFSTDPAGGNPAGVVLDATGVDDSTMLATAADVGFSETAFVVPLEDGSLGIRYFSPLAEGPFCGHATKAGPVSVSTSTATDGSVVATLVSVPPRTVAIPDTDLTEILAALRWSIDDLDPALPPRAAYAGAWHPVIAAAVRSRLANLDYDMPALADLMRRNDWATVDLVWRESPTVYHARNPF